MYIAIFHNYALPLITITQQNSCFAQQYSLEVQKYASVLKKTEKICGCEEVLTVSNKKMFAFNLPLKKMDFILFMLLKYQDEEQLTMKKFRIRNLA